MGQSSDMTIPLTDFEISILNKVVPTQSLGDYEALQTVLRRHVTDQMEHVIATGLTTEPDFKKFQVTTCNHILSFLVNNEFLRAREGNVYYLTERGKHLRTQGSIEQFITWHATQHKEYTSELKEVKNTGFVAAKQKDDYVNPKQKTNWVLPVIGVLLLAALIYWLKTKA